MDDGKEIITIPPEFDPDLIVGADEPDHKPDAEEWFPLDELPVPDQIETIFDDEITFEQSEMERPAPVVREQAVEAGVSQQLVPVASRPDTALIPARRSESGPQRLPLSPPAEFAAAPEKHVVFTLAGASYAVPMSHILEVCELEHFTPVPNVPEWVMGITNLRGDIVSIVDVRALLGSDPDDYADARSLLVTQTLEGDITICLAVERVIGLANLSITEIQPIDTLLRDRLTPYVRGVYANSDELVTVLNLESLLRSLEIVN